VLFHLNGAQKFTLRPSQNNESLAACASLAVASAEDLRSHARETPTRHKAHWRCVAAPGVWSWASESVVSFRLARRTYLHANPNSVRRVPSRGFNCASETQHGTISSASSRFVLVWKRGAPLSRLNASPTGSRSLFTFEKRRLTRRPLMAWRAIGLAISDQIHTPPQTNKSAHQKAHVGAYPKPER
jgi:hypothetical protein